MYHTIHTASLSILSFNVNVHNFLKGTIPTGHWSRHAATNIISGQTNIVHVWPAVYFLTSRLALQQKSLPDSVLSVWTQV